MCLLRADPAVILASRAPTTGSEILLQDFAVTLGRDAESDPFPPKIIQTV